MRSLDVDPKKYALGVDINQHVHVSRYEVHTFTNALCSAFLIKRTKREIECYFSPIELCNLKEDVLRKFPGLCDECFEQMERERDMFEAEKVIGS